MSETLQISRRDGEAGTDIALSGEFTIYAAAEVHAVFSEALDAARGINLDLSGVGEFDSSALQMLRALGCEAALRGLAFNVTAQTPCADELRSLLGLTSTFRDAGKEQAWT